MSLYIVKFVYLYKFLAFEWFGLLCPGFYFKVIDSDNLQPFHTAFIPIHSTKLNICWVNRVSM